MLFTGAFTAAVTSATLTCLQKKEKLKYRIHKNKLLAALKKNECHGNIHSNRPSPKLSKASTMGTR